MDLILLLQRQHLLQKRSKVYRTQIVSILKQQEAGRSFKDICREHSISAATFYNWKSKYGGMEASDVNTSAIRKCIKKISDSPLL